MRTSSLLGSRQGLLSSEPLRIELLNAFDFETKALEQEGAGEVVADSGVGDLDCDSDRIAGPVHVFVRLELQCRQDFGLRGIVGRVGTPPASEEGKSTRRHCPLFIYFTIYF